MRTCLCLALVLCLSVVGHTQEKPGKTPVRLDAVKHARLLADIKAQKGKVVVIDFWADFCLPCKKEFPHLVEMHREFAAKGLVCMSVSVDEIEDRDKAFKFLQKQEATFSNYIVDEKAEVWQNHWDFIGPPAVFVFGPDGKMAGRFDHNDPDKRYTYKDVRNLAVKLLNR